MSNTDYFPAKTELYTCLMEEAAEVIQAVSKILRFGEESRGPNYEYRITNREQLETELGDLAAVITRLSDIGYVDLKKVEAAMGEKQKKLDKYLVKQ